MMTLVVFTRCLLVTVAMSEGSTFQLSIDPLHGRRYKKHSSTKLKQHPKLHHSQKGCLSISLAGDEFAFTFLKVLPLDSTHQESLGCALPAPSLLFPSSPPPLLFSPSVCAPTPSQSSLCCQLHCCCRCCAHNHHLC